MITTNEFKKNFNEIIVGAKAGNNFAIASSEDQQLIGYFISHVKNNNPKRKLGLLKGKAKAEFMPYFKN